MATRVYLDGRIVREEEAVVSVFDRGFLYGDSIFEVLRTYGGKPFAFAEHWERLEGSAAQLGIETGWTKDAAASALRQTIEETGNDESYLRMIVTRGGGEIGLDVALATNPVRIIIVRSLVQPPAELYERGCRVKVVGVHRASSGIDPRVKSGNYLVSVQAIREARAAGAYEAILLNAAHEIAEGSSSNVFVVQRGEVSTPPVASGILEGITRRAVIEVCRRRGIRVRERHVTPDHLRDADEAFITSTIREVMPVTACDDHTIANGAVGPITRSIAAAFRRHAAHSASWDVD